jgi:hypothetical protein
MSFPQPPQHSHPSLDDDSEIPRIDLTKEFGPENPNVQVNPMFSALSIGMQQMPGGLEGMKYSMLHFMNATDRRYHNRDVDPRAIERMMFDPDERTIDRIISLMEARYDEVEEMEQRLLREHLEKLKKRQEEMMRAELQRRAREEEESKKNNGSTSENESESSHSSSSEDAPIIEEVSE